MAKHLEKDEVATRSPIRSLQPWWVHPSWGSHYPHFFYIDTPYFLGKIMKKKAQKFPSLSNLSRILSRFIFSLFYSYKIENEKRLRIEIERLIRYLVCLVYYSSSIDTMRNREERWEDGAITMRIECNLYIVFLEYKNVVFTPII